jgi:predicted AAA+ superfamily ATPase
MERYLKPQILRDLAKKMVLLTGPRQVGKTYLAKSIMAEFRKPQYLNFDVLDDRAVIKARTWPLDSDLLVFDEIHKMKGWKAYLKGVFDGRSPDQSILVTGSARLETFRQGGESLAGRYFHLRLHPLSVKEAAPGGSAGLSAPETLDRLRRLGGFPEPFRGNSEEEAARWRDQYATDLVREDVSDLARIHEIRAMRTLLDLLRTKVGSPLSFSSLARDLQIAPNTVKKYVSILEGLYIIFLVRPYHRRLARAILKEPKAYFYDTGFVTGDAGARFENACAAALLKHVHFLHDTKGRDIDLRYTRTKEGREVDFAVVLDGRPAWLIEAKRGDATPDPSLAFFRAAFKPDRTIQLVQNLRRETHQNGVEVVRAAEWLAGLEA